MKFGRDRPNQRLSSVQVHNRLLDRRLVCLSSFVVDAGGGALAVFDPNHRPRADRVGAGTWEDQDRLEATYGHGRTYVATAALLADVAFFDVDGGEWPFVQEAAHRGARCAAYRDAAARPIVVVRGASLPAARAAALAPEAAARFAGVAPAPADGDDDDDSACSDAFM